MIGCIALLAVFPVSLTAVGQQYPPTGYVTTDSPNANAYPEPRPNNVWQREAVQMITAQKQRHAAAVQTAAIPQNPTPKAIQSQNKSYFIPPVHVPPTAGEYLGGGMFVQQKLRVQTPDVDARAQTSFEDSLPAANYVQQPNQPGGESDVHTNQLSSKQLGVNEFEAQQAAMSPENSRLPPERLLNRRRTGLQDRIADILASSRYQTVNQNTRVTQRIEMAGRDLNQVRASKIARPTIGPKRDDMSIALQKVQAPLARRPATRIPQRNYVNPANLTRIPNSGPISPRHSFEQRTAAPEQMTELTDSRVVSLENSRDIPPDRTRSQQSGQDIQRVAASDPVLSDPIQDPFGDRPPLRSPVRHAHEQEPNTSRVQGDEISILNSPDEQDISYGADAQYDYAPRFQEDGELPRIDSFQDDNQVPRSDELTGGLDDDLNRVGDDLQDDLEELPPGVDDAPMQDFDDEFDVNDPIQAPVEKSCDEFRSRLLDNAITSISLDMSPPKSKLQSKSIESRTWTDRSGIELATGTMEKLSRGYVILDNGQKLATARLSDSDLAAISKFWQIPLECTIGNEEFAPRSWIPQTFTWTASSLCHKPLYFENIQLERYGHSYGPVLQPVHSTVHFFTRLVFLPYQKALHPSTECQYALGFYRPGDCAPWLKDPIPLSLDGFTRQTLVTLGWAYIP